MNTKQLIKSCLEEALLLQIATSVDNTPWICTVCFGYDSRFNLYWFSRHSARHSQEIVRNPHVAAAIAVPYGIGDKPRGLQFDGIVYELHQNPEVSLGLVALKKRYGVKPKRVKNLKEELIVGSVDYGLYCLRPNTIVLYDTLNFPDSPRKIYEISNK